MFIDGIAQLTSPYVIKKSRAFQASPAVPDFDKEAGDAVKYDGLPPLTPSKAPSDTVVFTNVKSVFTRSSDKVQSTFTAQASEALGVVVVRRGKIECAGSYTSCVESFVGMESPTFVDLDGGSISPGLVSFGSPLGLDHIDQENSTRDGDVFDPLTTKVPKILGGEASIVRAIDGLQYTTRDALLVHLLDSSHLFTFCYSLAYRAGVTTGITAPSHTKFFSGLGTSFSTGVAHKLQRGSINKEVTALHVTVSHFGTPSVSTQIGVLRRLLLAESDEGEAGQWWKKAREVSRFESDPSLQ